MGFVRILFVCLGNICRSPMAEGVFRHMIEERGYGDHFIVDSAGTGGWHIGAPPDERARSLLDTRGIDISRLRARQFSSDDFEKFDLIIAMDRSNMGNILKLSEAARDKVRLMTGYIDDTSLNDIPDPYYGGQEGFENVYQLILEASQGLLTELERSSIIQRNVSD